MHTLHEFLTSRAAATDQVEAAQRDGDTTIAELFANDIVTLDHEIDRSFGDHIDAELRAALTSRTRRTIERRIERRDLTGNARTALSRRSFTSKFMGAAVQAAPLLDLAEVLTTDDGSEIDFGYSITQPTAQIVTVDGATITASAPTLGANTILRAYKYPLLVRMPREQVHDQHFSLEDFASARSGPLVARKLSVDLWRGATASSASPEGLLGGLGTVTAGGAAVVTFADIAALLEAVPAAYRYGGNCSIIMSAGAHADLTAQAITSGAGLLTATECLNVPYRVDAELSDPASAAKSVVAGDFKLAYLVRLPPLRIDINDSGAAYNTEHAQLRVALRADGRRMVTDACRTLVHP